MRLRPDPDWHAHARRMSREGVAVKEIAARLGKSITAVREALSPAVTLVPSLAGELRALKPLVNKRP